MKKRGKQKAVSAFKSHQSATISLESVLQDARTFPIIECWISADWEAGSGLVQIIVARQQPNGKICCGVYLVDKFCLGLKDTFAKVNLSLDRYKDVYDRIASRQPLKECSVELVHQMIYSAIEYGARFGFTPQRDFAQSQYVLEPHGELDEPYRITFGQNGKPLFIAGPYDDTEQILQQLDKTAGPGKYDYIAPPL
ncbi:MAG: hypothetical protein E6J34_04205 [Chloroflexi bacterium]|nr:MAG: hypothetical protein E6J34_04205 [Chloroflexota bacterium]